MRMEARISSTRVRTTKGLIIYSFFFFYILLLPQWRIQERGPWGPPFFPLPQEEGKRIKIVYIQKPIKFDGLLLYINDFALSLVLKLRLGAAWKWSFVLRVIGDILWTSCFESYGPKDTR